MRSQLKWKTHKCVLHYRLLEWWKKQCSRAQNTNNNNSSSGSDKSLSPICWIGAITKSAHTRHLDCIACGIILLLRDFHGNGWCRIWTEPLSLSLSRSLHFFATEQKKSMFKSQNYHQNHKLMCQRIEAFETQLKSVLLKRKIMCQHHSIVIRRTMDNFVRAILSHCFRIFSPAT